MHVTNALDQWKAYRSISLNRTFKVLMKIITPIKTIKVLKEWEAMSAIE